jgi:hypothetical protein
MTLGTEEIMVEEAVQTSIWQGCANPHMVRLCKLHYSQSRVMPGPQQVMSSESSMPTSAANYACLQL